MKLILSIFVIISVQLIRAQNCPCPTMYVAKTPTDTLMNCTCMLQNALDDLCTHCNDVYQNATNRIVLAASGLASYLQTVSVTLNIAGLRANAAVTTWLNAYQNSISAVIVAAAGYCSALDMAFMPLQAYMGCLNYRVECMKIHDMLDSFNPTGQASCMAFPGSIMNSTGANCSQIISSAAQACKAIDMNFAPQLNMIATMLETANVKIYTMKSTCKLNAVSFLACLTAALPLSVPFVNCTGSFSISGTSGINATAFCQSPDIKNFATSVMGPSFMQPVSDVENWLNCRQYGNNSLLWPVWKAGTPSPCMPMPSW